MATDRDLVALDSYEDPVRVKAAEANVFLAISQRGKLIRDERPGRRGEWRVTTLAYRYAISASDDPGEESLIYWHWDSADGRGPHVHAPLLDPRGAGIRMHIPTGGRRVSLEQVVRWLIEEWAALPCRKDWEEVLDDGQARFDRYRVRDRDA